MNNIFREESKKSPEKPSKYDSFRSKNTINGFKELADILQSMAPDKHIPELQPPPKSPKIFPKSEDYTSTANITVPLAKIESTQVLETAKNRENLNNSKI